MDVNLLTRDGEHALSMCLNEKAAGMKPCVRALIACQRTDFDVRLKSGLKLRSVVLKSRFHLDYLNAANSDAGDKDDFLII